MSLSLQGIYADFYKELETAERQMAQRVGIDFDTVVNTPQKITERKALAQAMANVFYRQITRFAEVIVPPHPPNAAMTGPAPPGNHVHSTNQPPIDHKKGKII